MFESDDYRRNSYKKYPPKYIAIYIEDQAMMQCGLCCSQLDSRDAFFNHWVRHIKTEKQYSKQLESKK